MKLPDKLPDYVALKETDTETPAVLRTPAKELTFPLSAEDQRDVAILEMKYDQEKNCAGLAAPQIGISKRIIVFAAPADEDLKKWRSDFTDTMPKTIWINPSYIGVTEDKHEDFEGCFSVENLAGPVKRYKAIQYKAYTPAGEPIEGVAHGFLARIIQHEVDHLNGTLCIMLAPKDKIIKVDEYRRRRAEAMGKDIEKK